MKPEYKCYSKGCTNKASYKWHPSKHKGHLHVCKEHFDILTQVYSVKDEGEEDGLKVVRIIPEQP